MAPKDMEKFQERPAARSLEKLAELFKRKGLAGPDGAFALPFNMKRVTYHPDGQLLIGAAVYETIRRMGLKPAAMGGMTTGADPVAIAAAFASRLKDDPIHAFVIRKKAKDHGIKGQVEGNAEPGDPVVMLDDFAVTGKTMIESVDIAKKTGLNVLAALILLDMSGGKALENIQAHVPRALALLTPKDF
ncbi:putative Orotate phosphoribosyltransferase [Candidatus Desulfarcum epimagneticum]|uniref:Orotate phosphoribosyltransferase n=1 Tax=uncultured Desulfobacteraceae bacterium TaxID=218296 RepID=A0A484HR68_9BACT|nr:putative Orotate phosphoribosyltransferase [uncultured Desulfobacteraceae bacterium]